MWPSPHCQPQGQYLSGSAETSIRTTFLQIARALVGTRDTEPVVLDLCYPFDSPDRQRTMGAAQTKCSLLCAGIARCGAVRHKLLEGPYWGRNNAHSRIEQIARDHGAWLGHDASPAPGCFLMIGTDVPLDAPGRAKIISQWGTPGHAAVVESVEADHITTIDGGRGPIVRTRRKLVRMGSQLWVSDMTMRRVWGVIDPAKFKFDPAEQWCLPRGAGYPGYAPVSRTFAKSQ